MNAADYIYSTMLLVIIAVCTSIAATLYGPAAGYMAFVASTGAALLTGAE